MNEIRAIEECALNAWPGIRQLVLDGWLLRFADGHTRRANSVNPLWPGSGPVEARIARAEALYAAMGLPCAFRLTPLADPPDLDARLAARGYRAEAPTAVQVLENIAPAAAPEPAVTIAEPPPGTVPEDWLAAFARLAAVPEPRRPALQSILAHLAAQPAFAALTQEGRTLACGLGVRQHDTLGLFDIVTDPIARGRGHAERLIRALLHHGAQRGVRRAYLQVMLDNAPALRLYERLGFRELYRYHYRIREE